VRHGHLRQPDQEPQAQAAASLAECEQFKSLQNP
jgi:hypothetical protein